MSNRGKLKVIVAQLEDLKFDSLDALEKINEAIEIIKQVVEEER